MKRLTAILLTITMTFMLTACGDTSSGEGGTASESDKNEYAGTWTVTSADMDGSNFTISELEATGDYSLSDVCMILKDGGKAYIDDGTTNGLVDWTETDNGVKIGVQECSLEDGLLSITNNGITLYFEKTSDDQTIPSNTDQSGSGEDEATDDAGEVDEMSATDSSTEDSDGIDPEFKASMDSYEEFFNEYVDFMKKYNDSDDTSAMLSDYSDFMLKYTETMQKFQEIDTDELNTEEALYYAEVSARITKKLAEIV